MIWGCFNSQQLPAGPRIVVNQHFPAKLFNVFDNVLSICKENPAYGAHIVAMCTTKITKYIVFDRNRFR